MFRIKSNIEFPTIDWNLSQQRLFVKLSLGDNKHVKRNWNQLERVSNDTHRELCNSNFVKFSAQSSKNMKFEAAIDKTVLRVSAKLWNLIYQLSIKFLSPSILELGNFEEKT